MKSEPSVGSHLWMSSPRGHRLAALTSSLPVECRSSSLGEEGLFATAACEADTVILSDVPLCWLPEVRENTFACAACGAFIGSNAQRLAALDPRQPSALLTLPVLDDDDASDPAKMNIALPKSCGASCPRRTLPSPDLAVTAGEQGWDQVQLASQLVAHTVAAHAACDRADGNEESPSWRAALDAMASPPWDEVCRASRGGSSDASAGASDEDDDPLLPRKTLPALVAALRESGLPHSSITAVVPCRGKARATGEELWGRALATIARNAIWVQIPSPLVFYLARLGEGLDEGDARCSSVLPQLAGVIERIADHRRKRAKPRRGEEGGQRKRLRRNIEEEALESEEEEEEEEEGEDDDEEDENDDAENEDGEDEDSEEEEEDGDEEEESDGEEELRFDWGVPAANAKVSGSRNSTESRRLRFSSSLFPAHKGTALFPLISKVNHSCRPNCYLLWTSCSVASLVASVDIRPGDELQISYLGEKAECFSAARRRRWLRENYGFECRCEECAAAMAAAAASR